MPDQPFVPRDIVRRRSGPPKPAPKPGGAPPISSTTTTRVNKSSYASDQAQDSTQALIDESQDLNRVHQQTLLLLTPGSSLSQIGAFISESLGKLSPGGTAIFAPIVTDFQTQALAEIDLQGNSQDPGVSDGTFNQLQNLIFDLPRGDVPLLIDGLKIALSIQRKESERRKKEEAAVTRDAVRGYRSTVNTAAQMSELIASYGPRLWSETSRNPAVALGDLSRLLQSASDIVYNSYAQSVEAALATHAVVRGSLEKERVVSQELAHASALLSAGLAAYNLFNNQPGIAPSPEQVLNLMKQAALSALKPEIQKVRNLIERKLSSLAGFEDSPAPKMSQIEKDDDAGNSSTTPVVLT